MKFLQLVFEENNTIPKLWRKILAGESVKSTYLRNILNINSLSFPFFAFHNFLIFIFNFSVLRLLQSYLRLLVTSFLRDLKTPWLSGWRIWPKTVLKSVWGKWKFLMDSIRDKILSKKLYTPGVSEPSWCAFAPYWPNFRIWLLKNESLLRMGTTARLFS